MAKDPKMDEIARRVALLRGEIVGPTRLAGGVPDPAEVTDKKVPDLERCLYTGIHEKRYSAAAAVVSMGETIFHRELTGSLVTPPPLRRVPDGTFFDLGSLSQPFGSTLALLYLASKGRLELGSPITRVLPKFPADPYDKITVDMLLDHTSGLPPAHAFWQAYEDEIGRPERNRTVGTFKAVAPVQEVFAQIPLQAAPGTQVGYSHLGAMLAGWVVEAVAGKRLDLFLTQEVLAPLELHKEIFFMPIGEAGSRKPGLQFSVAAMAGVRAPTAPGAATGLMGGPGGSRGLSESEKQRRFAATSDCPWRGKVLQGEVHDRNAWTLGGVAGHAGLFATVDGLWRLVWLLWASLRGHTDVFHAGTVRRFWTRSKRVAHTRWALGWEHPHADGSTAGKRISRHAVGFVGDNGSSVWVDPATDVLSVALVNGAHPTLEDKAQDLNKLRTRFVDLAVQHGEVLSQGRNTGSGAF